MLDLYILTKDRTEQLKTALVSALGQDNDNIQIIVSDNSESSETSQMMHNEFSKVRYVRRIPHLDAAMHSKKVIEEATSKYLMLFHDDDILLPSHISAILDTFESYSEVVAVASNGNFI